MSAAGVIVPIVLANVLGVVVVGALMVSKRSPMAGEYYDLLPPRESGGSGTSVGEGGKGAAAGGLAGVAATVLGGVSKVQEKAAQALGSAGIGRKAAENAQAARSASDSAGGQMANAKLGQSKAKRETVPAGQTGPTAKTMAKTVGNAPARVESTMGLGGAQQLIDQIKGMSTTGVDDAYDIVALAYSFLYDALLQPTSLMAVLAGATKDPSAVRAAADSADAIHDSVLPIYDDLEAKLHPDEPNRERFPLNTPAIQSWMHLTTDSIAAIVAAVANAGAQCGVDTGNTFGPLAARLHDSKISAWGKELAAALSSVAGVCVRNDAPHWADVLQGLTAILDKWRKEAPKMEAPNTQEAPTRSTQT